MKINGWQRIGIVASVVWVLYSFTTTDDRLNIQDAQIAVEEEHLCLDSHPADEFDKWLPVCDSLTPERMQAQIKKSRENERAAILEAIVPVPLAWITVYLLLFLFRWIRAGFVKREHENRNGRLPE